MRGSALSAHTTMRGSFVVAIVLAAATSPHAGAEVHVLGKLMPEQGIPAAGSHLSECQTEIDDRESRLSAQQAEISVQQLRMTELDSLVSELTIKNLELANELELTNYDARDGDGGGDASRLLTAQTPAPTLTPVPTPLSNPPTTTAVPTATPSVTLVPTAFTPYRKLVVEVADVALSEVVVEENVLFPSQSPIVIEAGQSVSIVGRLAANGGPATLDGYAHSRLFSVLGGSLNLTTLILVNGTAPQPGLSCRPREYPATGRPVCASRISCRRLTMPWFPVPTHASRPGTLRGGLDSCRRWRHPPYAHVQHPRRQRLPD